MSFRSLAAVGLIAVGSAFTTARADETQVALNYNFNGLVHNGEAGFADEPTGFRSISDRALRIDGLAGSLGANPIVGGTGLNYSIVQSAYTLDIVHLGNRAVFWPYDATVDGDNIGIQPAWDTNPDHTTPQTTSGLSIPMYANTRIGFLYQASNNGGNFQVVLGFTDSSSVTVTLSAPDWFGANNPAAPGAGVASQTRLGATVWNATNSNDTANAAPANERLNVVEGIVSTASLIAGGMGNIDGKTLSSITFQNAAYPPGTGRGYAIMACTVNGAAVFPPSGSGAVTPNPAVYNQSALFTVNVTPGSGSPNTITGVTVDASSINSGTLILNDSGQNGDATPGDNVWSLSITIPGDAPAGNASVPFDIVDAQGRHGNGTIDFAILAPPSADDIGQLGLPATYTFNGTMESGAVKWLTFTLDQPIDRAALTFLDIDTEGSSISGGAFANDTMIGLYTVNGNLVVSDDDDGSDFLSQISIGSTVARPAFGNGVAYNGRDGATLAAGTYYLAYTAYPATFGATNWNVTTTHTHSGTIAVNFRTGTANPIIAGPIHNPANNSDYYLVAQGFNFTQAEAFAQTLGGHLASIGDADENEFVRASVLEFDGLDRRGWIGFTDEAGEGNFVWTDGSSVTYTNWNPGEPNNAGGVENYAEMLGSNGQWNDLALAGVAAGDYALVEVPGQGGGNCPWNAPGSSNCVADYNGSGGTPDDADVSAFFFAWNSGEECADANQSGGTPDDADIATFFLLWNNGGC